MLGTATKAVYKNKEKTSTLSQKLIFTSVILILIQFLSQIPIWGINREYISLWIEGDMSSIFGMFNIFSGMSFQNLSLFALGIAPYITASIILQLLRVAITPLDQMCKDSHDEKKFVEKITFILAFFIGILQVVPLVVNIASSGLLTQNTMPYKLLVGGSILMGSAIVIALGKVIDKKGVGNGISLILLINILSSLKMDFIGIYQMFISGKDFMTIGITIAITLIVIVFSLLVVIYLHEGKKDIKVMFSGRMQGGKIVKAPDSVIPLKVNMSGVMPVIFASTFVQLIPMVAVLFKAKEGSVLLEISKYFNQTYWFNFSDIKYTIGVVFFFIAVVFFSYFYNMISFNTYDIANNLNKQGGTIAGIRPGKTTKEYLDAQVRYMILLGSLMLIIVAIIPMIIGGIANIGLSFGGTSIIIVVSVLLETYKTINIERTKLSVLPKSYKMF